MQRLRPGQGGQALRESGRSDRVTARRRRHRADSRLLVSRPLRQPRRQNRRAAGSLTASISRSVSHPIRSGAINHLTPGLNPAKQSVRKADISASSPQSAVKRRWINRITGPKSPVEEYVRFCANVGCNSSQSVLLDVMVECLDLGVAAKCTTMPVERNLASRAPS